MVRTGMLAALAACTLLVPAAPAQAQTERTRCFTETGFCVRGEILDYWERNGGLAVFGYPTTAEIPNENVEDTFVGRTQWFQRDRLEVHTDGVQAGRLGARLLEVQGRPWQSYQTVTAAPSSCDYFPETGHTLCEPFRSYWKQNGGLLRFGYPLTEPMTETIGDWRGTVQYFERRRMEHHLELRGTRYEVLLGLLGNELISITPPVRCDTDLYSTIAVVGLPRHLREQMGCPGAAWEYVPAAFQPFENGYMTWLDIPGRGKQIFVVAKDPYAPGRPDVWSLYPDSWAEGELEDTIYTAPAGRYEPQRGFGKLWANNKFVRGALGWATAPERQTEATIQQFSSGAYVIRLGNAMQLYYYGAKPTFTGIYSQ